MMGEKYGKGGRLTGRMEKKRVEGIKGEESRER
jgi:hypothetical protein